MNRQKNMYKKQEKLKIYFLSIRNFLMKKNLLSIGKEQNSYRMPYKLQKVIQEN